MGEQLCEGTIKHGQLTGTLALNLKGNNAGNALFGNFGNNVISGGFGNDVIAGGLGNDALNGGAGLDIFVFNTAPNAATNRDVIVGFVAADDTIRLENTGVGLFNTLAAGTLAVEAFAANASGIAADDADRIIYNTLTGALFYDADGNGAGAAIQFATLFAAPQITHAGFLIV